MQKSILISVLIGFAQCVSYLSYDIETLQRWEEYKLTYGKDYNSIEEDNLRLAIFAERLRKVSEHNQLYELGQMDYEQKINEFSDMSQQEFLDKFTGLDSPLNTNDLIEDEEEITFIEPANVGGPPGQIDWRTKGAVTPVKNQSDCGASWSFSATGAMEGQYFRKTRKLITLSEQNLIDCAGKFGSHGCRGGLPKAAFKYVQANKGIENEKSYPYEGKDLQCRYNHIYNANLTVKGVVNIRRANEYALMTAVATIGPISACIDVHHESFSHYSSGVYYEPNCRSDHLGHSVLVVGYGAHNRLGEYWIVKNSWGTNWGNHGYILMARNRRNNCGIATAATYPII